MVTTFNKTDFEGSGWSSVVNVFVTLNYGKYEPFRRGCSTLDLPKWIADKKAAISIITGSQKCFYWCTLRHFNPRIKDRGIVDKTLKRIEKEEPNKYANFTGVKYPVICKGIDKFQKRNPHLHTVIYGVDNQTKRTPVIYDGKEHVNGICERIHILYYFNHYYLVNALSRLIVSQIREYSGKKKNVFLLQMSKQFFEIRKINRSRRNM